MSFCFLSLVCMQPTQVQNEIKKYNTHHTSMRWNSELDAEWQWGITRAKGREREKVKMTGWNPTQRLLIIYLRHPLRVSMLLLWLFWLGSSVVIVVAVDADDDDDDGYAMHVYVNVWCQSTVLWSDLGERFNDCFMNCQSRIRNKFTNIALYRDSGFSLAVWMYVCVDITYVQCIYQATDRRRPYVIRRRKKKRYFTRWMVAIHLKYNEKLLYSHIPTKNTQRKISLTNQWFSLNILFR